MPGSDHGYHKKGNHRFCRKVTVFILSVFLMLVGGVSLVCSIYLQQQYSDLEKAQFQLWIGLPLFFNGLFGVLISFLPLKSSWKSGLLYIFGTLNFVMCVTCAFGAFILGISYWKNNWGLITRYPCSDISGKCTCGYVKMPLMVDDCSLLPAIQKILIVEISMSCFGWFFSIFEVLTTMSLLCYAPKLTNDQPKDYEPVTMTRKINPQTDEVLFHYNGE